MLKINIVILVSKNNFGGLGFKDLELYLMSTEICYDIKAITIGGSFMKYLT